MTTKPSSMSQRIAFKQKEKELKTQGNNGFTQMIAEELQDDSSDVNLRESNRFATRVQFDALTFKGADSVSPDGRSEENFN